MLRLAGSATPTVLAALALAGCGAGAPTLTLDATTVETQLAWLGDNVPGCDTAGGTTTARRAVDVMREALLQAGIEARRSGPVSFEAGVGSSGVCGGSVIVSSEHANGVTDYVVELSGFCVSGDDGDQVYDGVILASEKGRPSDEGPIISALEAHTDGAVVATHGSDVYEVEVTDLRVDWGVPATWSPGVADADNPDVVHMGELRIAGPDAERDLYVRDLTYERTGALASAEVTIVDGVIGNTADGQVRVATADGEPLGVSISGSGIGVTGAVVLTGAGGTEATVRAVAGAPGQVQVELEGMPQSTTLDCGGAIAPAVSLATAFSQALPVY